MIYKKQSIVFIISFIIISFFWVAVPYANAGAPPFDCPGQVCNVGQVSCEFDDFCCVGGTLNPCISCFWTGNECVNPGPSGACCLTDGSCEILTETE